MSGRVELRVLSIKDTKAKTHTTSLFNGKLDGHVVRLGCNQATTTEVSCWIQTSENYVYFTMFKAVVNPDGNLVISDKRKNRYTVGENQFIKDCSVSNQFMTCTSEDLTISDPKKKTTVLVFRAYPDSKDQTFYSFSTIHGDKISEIPPELSTIEFKNVARLRRRMLPTAAKDSAKDQSKNSKQEAVLYGANQKTIRKYTMKLNPALIKINVDKIDKNPDFKKIGVKAIGENKGAKEAKLSLGDLKNTPGPKPNPSNTDPDKPIPSRNTGIGFFGWLIIILVIALIAWGIWFFMRREQLKEKARDDLMYGTNEMEKYD